MGRVVVRAPRRLQDINSVILPSLARDFEEDPPSKPGLIFSSSFFVRFGHFFLFLGRAPKQFGAFLPFFSEGRSTK